jgi:predicted TIM-barrel enzyme
MTSEDDPATRSGEEWVIIASFENRHATEHMLASLGHEFRHHARKGHADAFVVSGNSDGSLKLTQSRVLEASGFAATTARLSIFMMAGLIGVGAS